MELPRQEGVSSALAHSVKNQANAGSASAESLFFRGLGGERRALRLADRDARQPKANMASSGERTAISRELGS